MSSAVRFQPLPIRTAREVFPQAAHPVSFIEGVMCRLGRRRLSHNRYSIAAIRGSGFAFRYIRRRRYCRLIGAFVISPLPHLEPRNIHRSGPFPPDAFCCTSINSTATRSATLAPAPALPTRGYSSRLLDEISSPGTEGFSSCHILLLTMLPLIPRRREPPHRTHFDRLLLLSHAVDRLSLRVYV